jgi:hypothetical protein
LQFLESAGRLSAISLDQYTTARWALAGLPAKKMLLSNSMPQISKCRNPNKNIVGSIYNCKVGPGGAASREDAALQLNATNK